MMTRASSTSRRSFGMNLSRGIIRSTTGCRPATISSSNSSVIVGREYPSRAATSANVRQHVELGDRPRDALKPADLAAHPRPQSLEQLALALLDSLRRRENALLVLLERWRDESLARRDRLPSLVVRGHEVKVRLRDLDVVAEHLVEADLERRDARPRPFVALNSRDRVLPTVAKLAQLVELAVHVRQNARLVSDRQRARARRASSRCRARSRGRRPSPAASRRQSSRARNRARSASPTAGSAASESPSARSSRGVLRPDAAFAASRSTSRTRAIAVRIASRAMPSANNPATASSRDSIVARAVSGARIHCRSSRAPIGVCVRSSTESSVPSFAACSAATQATPPARGSGASSRPAPSRRQAAR